MTTINLKRYYPYMTENMTMEEFFLSAMMSGF